MILDVLASNCGHVISKMGDFTQRIKDFGNTYASYDHQGENPWFLAANSGIWGFLTQLFQRDQFWDEEIWDASTLVMVRMKRLMIGSPG